MGISFLEFKSNLGILVRPNRFTVEFNPPAKLNESFTSPSMTKILQSLIYHVKSASIPQRTIGEAEYKFYGMTLKLPGDTEYEDLTIGIINEEEWNFRTFFEKWQDLIIKAVNNEKHQAADIILDSSCIVHQYSIQGDEPIASYKFHSIFPKTVDAIELSMDTQDSIEEFNVTFAYSYWEKI